MVRQSQYQYLSKNRWCRVDWRKCGLLMSLNGDIYWVLCTIGAGIALNKHFWSTSLLICLSIYNAWRSCNFDVIGDENDLCSVEHPLQPVHYFYEPLTILIYASIWTVLPSNVRHARITNLRSPANKKHLWSTVCKICLSWVTDFLCALQGRHHGWEHWFTISALYPQIRPMVLPLLLLHSQTDLLSTHERRWS